MGVLLNTLHVSKGCTKWHDKSLEAISGLPRKSPHVTVVDSCQGPYLWDAVQCANAAPCFYILFDVSMIPRMKHGLFEYMAHKSNEKVWETLNHMHCKSSSLRCTW